MEGFKLLRPKAGATASLFTLSQDVHSYEIRNALSAVADFARTNIRKLSRKCKCLIRPTWNSLPQKY